ncbi:hypothetical protein [Metabacillus bambusae]|uniref:Uncharacterized protein n=1 Tax=Metabacillus bambusae TaxID=2795218 RepID=A0ABS3MW14_9BACI|nr:hypothetical protein [Metabacillus bambusae]MBO1510118.1 hypothetical protein [Metabacillus bambusae]
MSGETLPGWFWFIYYLFLIVTLFGSSISIWKKKNVGLSVFTVFITILTPLLFLPFSIGRTRGNEFEHLISQTLQADMFAILCLLGFSLIIFWWVFFIITLKNPTKISN